MAANTEPVFIDSPLTTTANTQIANTFVNADSTDVKDIVNGATDGTVIQDLIATSNDSADRILNIYLYDGGASRLIGSVTIPDLSGTDGGTNVSVSLLNVTDIPSLDKRDDGVILLASGQKLQCAAQVAVTADKTITVTAIGGNL